MRRQDRTAGKKKKEKAANRLALMGITLVVLSLAVTVHLSGISMEEEEQLEKQKSEEEQRAQELEEYRIYVQTKEYIEKVAKEKLGLVNKDEILLKPEK